MIWRKPCFNDAVCSFDVQLYHSSISDQDWHSFSIRVKGENLQKLEFLWFTSYWDLCWILGWFIELESHSFSCINQGNLIRRWTLVKFITFFIYLGYYLMRDSKKSEILFRKLFATTKTQILTTLFISYWYISYRWAVSSFIDKVG